MAEKNNDAVLVLETFVDSEGDFINDVGPGVSLKDLELAKLKVHRREIALILVREDFISVYLHSLMAPVIVPRTDRTEDELTRCLDIIEPFYVRASFLAILIVSVIALYYGFKYTFG